MDLTEKKTFAFLILVFNHELYVIEHLESIKYLVLTHGDNIEVDLIISDDYSTDKSVDYINKWLDINFNLFNRVIKLFNSENLGTSKCLINLLSANVANKCKITAADDIYSYENIFLDEAFSRGIVMQSGFPLMLLNGSLKESYLSNFLQIATNEIYTKDDLIYRFKHFSLNNAPNIFYEVKCLENISIISFLNKFDVVEDWPIQIQIARKYPKMKFELIDKVFVYYRRTIGSTYIVANKRFISDKISIFDDLIKHEANFLGVIRLLNRKMCFILNNRLINIFFNMDFYFFLFSILINLKSIVFKANKVNLNFNNHLVHYEYINKKSKDFFMMYLQSFY